MSENNEDFPEGELSNIFPAFPYEPPYASQDVQGIDQIINDPAIFKRAALEAQRRTHPDQGGDIEAFRRVQAAIEVLKGRAQ